MFIEKPYKVAIVDDSVAMHKLLAELIKKNPAFEAVCFTDGAEALAYIEREKVRTVFVDVNMPSMFGDDLLRSCIALKLGIQVYVITGADSLTIADRCMNVGARGIIPKAKLAESSLQALAETERFFEHWNGTLKYFLSHKKTG